MSLFTWKQINAWRLAQHSLLEPAGREYWPRVVSQTCGLHAQVMSAAELSLWARVKDLSPADVRNALWRDRSLVKTWAMRGTLHLLAASEHAAYTAALNHSVAAYYRRPSWLKYHGLTLADLEIVVESAGAVLSDSGITREQLATAIAAHTGKPHLRASLLSGWGSLLKPAAHQGCLCFGPSEGQNVTFVHPEKWLKGWQQPDPELALQEILRRYLTAYGPATTDDFARWWGTDAAKAKKLIRDLGNEVVEVEVEGWKGWALTSTLDTLGQTKVPFSVRLLPYFDPYTVAVARQVQYLMPVEHKARVYRSQGWISPVVLVGGRIEGVWTHEQQRSRTVVKVEMFARTSTRVKLGIETEARRLGEFFKTEIQLTGIDGKSD